MAGFHILDALSLPKGVVTTDRGEPDYTQYIALIHISQKEYFVKTYQNGQIGAVRLDSIPDTGNRLRSLGSLHRPPHFVRWEEGITVE